MTKYSGLSWGERLLFKSIVLDLSSKYDFKAKEAISFLMKDMKTSKKKKKKEPRKNNSDRVVVSDTDSEISEFKTETPKVVLSITEQKKVERDKKKAGREAKKARKNAEEEIRKAEKKAKRERKKAEKLAKKEADKVAKKADREAKKKEKKEKELSDKLEKLKEPELKEETFEEEAEKPMTDGVISTKVNKFKFKGTEYLRDEDDILYDIKTHDEIGYYDEANNCIGEIMYEESDEDD